MIYRKGINIRRYFLPIINTLIYMFAFFYANNFFKIQDYKQSIVLFFSILCGIIFFIYARDIIKKDLSRAFEKIAYTIFGILYIGLPSFLIPFILNVDLNPQNPVPIFFILSPSRLTMKFFMVPSSFLLKNSSGFTWRRPVGMSIFMVCSFTNQFQDRLKHEAVQYKNQD